MRHAPLEPADAPERLERWRGLLRGQLAAVGQQDQLGGRGLAFADVLRKADDRAQRARQGGERREQIGPALLDPAPDLLLLREGQERPLAELAEVHSHEIGVLVRDGACLECFVRCRRVLVGSLLVLSSSPGRSSTG